ncbi:hypothetical protein P5G51_019370 [Virgibacillus sp. 179-BFC.A HS]|uniref:Uncharacterized protein n=1 Tax=Tigheibacillus jepli TaxID=3035914 RepID=A0ABU5CMY9_9BACI|nr:hypothetical protein [Virgibacillus sp. 179-BFC.A HS]MDY0407202.1 hypothetical protein [Virgibacillus sp. 179-BFC.A HS]
MREDNHEKRMFYKFIFLLVVTVLIAIVYIGKWTADDSKEQDPKEMFQKTEQPEDAEKQAGLDEDKINDVLTDDGDKNTEAQKTETKEESKQNEHTEKNQGKVDSEQKYINQYSKQEVGTVKEQVKKVLALYLLQITDWDKWDGAVTSGFLGKVKKEMTNFKDEKAKRYLDAIELFASKPLEDGEITFGAFATWHVTVKGKSISKPMQLYYITLQKEGENWLVSDMITPNNQNMEGEGKDKR